MYRLLLVRMSLLFDLLGIWVLLHLASRIIPFLVISAVFSSLGCLVLFSSPFFFQNVEYSILNIFWINSTAFEMIYLPFISWWLLLIWLQWNWTSVWFSYHITKVDDNCLQSALSFGCALCIFRGWGHIICSMYLLVKLEVLILHGKNGGYWDCFPIHYQ